MGAIALDTNIVVRLLTRDDERQARAVDRLLAVHASPEQPAWIGRIVTVETVWVLQRHYRYTRRDIARALDVMLQVPSLNFEDEPALLDALELYTQSRADFSDILIMLDAISAGAECLYTFDAKAARLPNCQLLQAKGAY